MSKIYLPLSVFPFKQTCRISESVRFADIIASNNQFVQQLVDWAFLVQHTEWLRQDCWLQGVTIGTRSLDFKMGAHCARQVDYRTSTLDWPTYASITYSRQKKPTTMGCLTLLTHASIFLVNKCILRVKGLQAPSFRPDSFLCHHTHDTAHPVFAQVKITFDVLATMTNVLKTIASFTNPSLSNWYTGCCASIR